MTSPQLHPDVIEFLDDQSLMEAYEQITCKPGDPVSDALIAEIERRDLNI